MSKTVDKGEKVVATGVLFLAQEVDRLRLEVAAYLKQHDYPTSPSWHYRLAVRKPFGDPKPAWVVAHPGIGTNEPTVSVLPDGRLLVGWSSGTPIHVACAWDLKVELGLRALLQVFEGLHWILRHPHPEIICVD